MTKGGSTGGGERLLDSGSRIRMPFVRERGVKDDSLKLEHLELMVLMSLRWEG